DSEPQSSSVPDDNAAGKDTSTDSGESTLGPIEIIRAEFTKGNRPVVGCPISPYVLVRDVPLETNDPPSADRKQSVEALPANEQFRQAVAAMQGVPVGAAKTWEAGENDPKVTWQWYRGPSIHNCVYHPHRPGTIRDVARTFRFYCSPECLMQGYKHLADDHCLPCPASDKEDDCMYCPWASIEEDEAAEHSTTATLGPDSAAPGSGRDQSPANNTSPPLPGASGSCWTPVANTRTYTPVPEDTDRVLCVKISSKEPVPSKLQMTRTVVRESGNNADDSSVSDGSVGERERASSFANDNASTSSGPVIQSGLQPLTSISQTGSGSVYLMTMPSFDPMTYSPPLREMLSVYGALDHIATGQAIKLLNWNILADIYCTPQQYPYCPPWALSWNYRRHLIIKQIAALEGDVVCLQEVQSDHFYSSLLPALEALGFGYLYAPKTREIFTDKYCEEGCAILYRKSRFSVVDSFTIEFDAHAKDSARYQGARSTKQRNRLSKGNVALACLLEDSRCGGRPLGIVNTHITADVDAGDVKLWQAMCMLEVVQGWSNSQNGVLPIIMCGDFNSTPDSAVYELLTTGRLSPSSIPAFSVMLERGRSQYSCTSGSVCVSAMNLRLGDDPYGILPPVSQMHHSLPLRSIYPAVVNSEATYTNYTQKFQGTLDYICFTQNSLRGLAVSNTYSYEELSAETALPSPTQPSDHILTTALDMVVTLGDRALGGSGGNCSSYALGRLLGSTIGRSEMSQWSRYGRYFSKLSLEATATRQQPVDLKIRGSNSVKESIPRRNGHNKVNGHGLKGPLAAAAIEELTARREGSRAELVDRLYSSGMKMDTIDSLPTDSLIRILHGLTARHNISGAKSDRRVKHLVERVAEVVSARAQDGDITLESLVSFLLRITQLDRLDLLQVAANLPTQRFDEFYTLGGKGLSCLATALQEARAAARKGYSYPFTSSLGCYDTLAKWLHVERYCRWLTALRADGRHCVSLADAALAHLAERESSGCLSAGKNKEAENGFIGEEEELVKVCVLLHRLQPRSESALGGMSFLARPEIINGSNGYHGELHPAVGQAARFLANSDLLERMGPAVLYGVLLKHASHLPEDTQQILREIFSRRVKDLPVTELQRCIVNLGPSRVFLERVSRYYGLYDVHADRQLVSRQCLESLGPITAKLVRSEETSEIWRWAEMPSLLLHAAHLAADVKKDFQMHVDLAVCCARVGVAKVQSKSLYDVIASGLTEAERIREPLKTLGEVCIAFGLPDRRNNSGARGRASEAAARFIGDSVGRLGKSTGEELARFGALLRATKWPMKQTWMALSEEARRRSWKANRSANRLYQNDTSPPIARESASTKASVEVKMQSLSPAHAYRLYRSFAGLHESMAATALPTVLFAIRRDDRIESLAALFQAWQLGEPNVGVFREAIEKCLARVEEASVGTLLEAIRVASLSGQAETQIEEIAEAILARHEYPDLHEGRVLSIAAALVKRKDSSRIAKVLDFLVAGERLSDSLAKCDTKSLLECHELCVWVGGQMEEQWNFVARRKVPDDCPDEELLSRLKDLSEKELAAIEALRNLGDRQCPSANGVTAGMGMAFFLMAIGNWLDEHFLIEYLL
ncbi:CCR4-NOT transcription complex subunit 6-like, partial [Perkinsus chesapeaki]